MTPVIAGSINRTPTGPHRRCDMFFIVSEILEEEKIPQCHKRKKYKVKVLKVERP